MLFIRMGLFSFMIVCLNWINWQGNYSTGYGRRSFKTNSIGLSSIGTTTKFALRRTNQICQARHHGTGSRFLPLLLKTVASVLTKQWSTPFVHKYLSREKNQWVGLTPPSKLRQQMHMRPSEDPALTLPNLVGQFFLQWYIYSMLRPLRLSHSISQTHTLYSCN